jgi:hypothetical protein
VDGFDQITDAAECPAADSFACDVGKPALDLFDLRRTAGREMHAVARSGGQPTLHSRIFVSAVIVQDQVDFQVRLNGLIDPVEESQIRHQIPDAKTRRDLIALPIDQDEPLRCSNRQRMEQDLIDQRINGGGCAGSEGGILVKPSQLEAKVVDEISNPARQPDLAQFLLRVCDASKLQYSLPPRFLRRHT